MKKVFVLLLLFVLFVTGCSKLYKIEKTEELMGTFVTITIIDRDVKYGSYAIKEAFKEMRRIEAIMSIYNETSEVFRLNEQGYLENASNELLFVIKKSLYYSNISNGAFDITVQPLLDLYTDSFKNNGRPPTEEEIEIQKQLVNYENIIIENKTILFKKKGIKITLGGIAKGYAIDRAMLILEKNDIHNALVNAGGDLKAIGTKEHNKSWTVALQNPRDRTDFITIIPVYNKAVATSGDYERYFVENKSAHHIMNPKTGKSATDLISVTIIAKNAIDADAIATAVFVLGEERGLDLIRKEKAEGLIITNNKEIYRTDGFKD